MSSRNIDQAGMQAWNVYERMARAFVVGCGACAEEGIPLNELQQIQFLSQLIATADGAQASAKTQLDFDSVLRQARDDWNRINEEDNDGPVA